MKYSPFVIVSLIVGFMWGSANAGAQEESMIPNGKLTLGGRMAESYFETTVDVLVPVYAKGQAMWFINPRATAGDDSSEEVNLGLGYRYLIPDSKIILGANIYYDSHWSSHGNRFDQLGLGAEMLTEWVDARFNYYLPENDEATVDSGPAKWGTPYAQGNGIIQEYWGLVEKPREGYDAEIGLKLPKLDKWAEVRIFAGYYNWQSQFSGGSDIDGVKGRIEIKPCRALTFDAEIFENDDLLGTDYYVGMRMQVPFNLGNMFAGRNPFEGAGKLFSKKPESNFASRMTEQVIRDQYIRLESGFADSSQKTTLLDNVMFADNVNGGSDGSAENPYLTIQDAVTAADSQGMENVFVQATGTTYTENVTLSDGVSLWGTVPAQGGETYGPSASSEMPTIDGASQGPAITLGNASGVHGMHIVNSGTGTGVTTDPVFGYDTTRTGIFGANVTDTVIQNNWIEDNDDGVLLTADSLADYDLQYLGNATEHNDGTGLHLRAVGTGAGEFTVAVNGGFTNNNNGMDIYADSFQSASADVYDMTAEVNSGDGASLDLSASDNVYITITDSDFRSNGSYGIDELRADSTAGGSTIILDNVNASNNGSTGIDDLFAYANGDNTPAVVQILDSEFNNNDYSGIGEAEAYTYGDNADSQITLSNVEVLGNDGYGIDDLRAEANGLDGDASLSITNSQFKYNDYEGVDEVEAVATDGGASILIDDVEVVNNFSYGMDYIEADAYGEGDDAIITITNSNYDSNDSDGIWRARARAYGDNGNAVLTMDNVSASANADEGINEARAEANGVNGNAIVNLNNITASNNEYDGIEDVEAYAAGTDGDATINMSAITANNNLDEGIYSVDASTSDGNATITMTDIVANSNNDEGIDDIEADAYGAGKNAVITLTDVTANYNNYDGIEDVDAYADDGSATVDATQITTNYNQDYGISISAYSGNTGGNGGDASVSYTDSSATHNQDYGAAIYSTSANGNAIINGDNNTAIYNNDDGLIVEADATSGTAIIDLGGGVQSSEGLNSLYNNGGFDLVNSGSGTAFIQDSWWGQDADPVSNGQTSGTVDAADWLSAEPQ